MNLGQNRICLTSMQSLGVILEAMERMEGLLAYPTGCVAGKAGVGFTYSLLSESEAFTKMEPAGCYERLILKLARDLEIRHGEGGEIGAIIACNLLRESLPLLAAGVNGADLHRELDTLRTRILFLLEEETVPLVSEEGNYQEGLIQTLTNDPALGDCISKAFQDVGHGGLIQFEVANSFECEYSFLGGAAFEKGFMSRAMANDKYGIEAVLENPLIVVTERPIVLTGDLISFMSRAIEQERPLLLIAEHVEDTPLQLMLVNKAQGGFQSVAIQAPKFGTERKVFLRDIAMLTGGAVISSETGDLGDAVESDILWQAGGAKRVVVTKERTIFYDAYGDEKEIKRRLLNARREYDTESDAKRRAFLMERITFLSGRIGQIRVSGLRDEAGAKIKLAERVVAAVRDAAVNGVVAGGGFALVRVASQISDAGCKYLCKGVCRAIEAPARVWLQRLESAPEVVLDAARSCGKYGGYDLVRRQWSSNLLKAGQVSSAEALRQAVAQAFSLVSMLISSEYLLSEY